MPKRKLDTTDTRDGSPKRPSAPASDSVVANSYFSDSSLNYRAPCTSGEGRMCDIFRDLRIWNEFLWPVGLELREYCPAELSLLEMRDGHVASEVPQRKQDAATLFQHLLTYHRCLISLELNGCIFTDHYQLICDALSQSPSLRELKLCLPSINTRALQKFTAALPLQNHLEQLECRLPRLDQTFCEGLSEFLGSTVSLTTFTLNVPVLMAHEGRILFQGLKRNATITTFSLKTHMKPYLNSHGNEFAEYLRDNQTLRTLILSTKQPIDHVEQRLIMHSLFRTTTLSEVKLVGFTMDDHNSGLVALLLRKNQSLRKFRMVKCSLYSDGYPPKSVNTHFWPAAVRENKTLEKLTMELSCFNLEQCRSLFEALKYNTTLKNITVERIRPEDAVEICRAMRETGVRERFFLGNPFTVQDPGATLTECRDLSSLDIDSRVLSEFDRFRTALRLLPSCAHVTSLSLVEREELFGNNVTNGLIAQYIAGTTVLRELTLTFVSRIWDPVDRVERALVQALSVNRSIRRLYINGLCFDESETQLLAETLQSTRTLHDLSFYPEDQQSTVSLVQKLSPNFSTNYTLLGLHVHRHEAVHCDLFTIDDVLGRNASLVSRAAQFVSGRRRRYLAAAAELVHSNSGLVELIRDVTCVNEDEVLSQIRNSLKSYSELDDFMRLAGVVKCGVTCHVRDDGEKQLADIGRDCWLCIRQYLKMGDILDEQ
ncbi:hypothetical protein HPB52_009884 [Rhipicephalus sanguineus]|uniref:Nlr family card domain protein n=1 Tax=Rhipicephalus sanguineus TaxID=34632 RepID=A0A9D4PIX4_RHISA|nr:hypothetical protein HPB52_009884 [Rhipicephalus sanguineus]